MFTKIRRLSLFLFLISNNPCFAIPSVNCADPEMAQLVEKAKKEISDRIYLTLATTKNSDSPWNTPLYTAFDPQYTFFWLSDKLSQHAKNIRNNKHAFAVIYDSNAPLFSGFGVYIEGNAFQLEDTDAITSGIKLITDRAGAPTIPSEFFQGTYRSRIFKFVPRHFWVNSVVNVDGIYLDSRIEITDCILPADNV